MNAHDYLAFLQKCFSDTMTADVQAAVMRLAAYRSKQLDNPDMVSLYKTMASDGLCKTQTTYVRENLLQDLMPALPETLQGRLHEIPVGVLPLRTVNACAAKSPEGTPLILFDLGLFTMVGFYMEIKPTMLVVEKTRGHDAMIEYITNAYRFVIDYYERAGDLSVPIPSPDFVVQKEIMVGYYAIMRGIELFVLAHEFGHIHAGHLDNAETKVTKLTGDAADTVVDADFYQLSWEQEYEADLLGWQWYQQVCLITPPI